MVSTPSPQYVVNIIKPSGRIGLDDEYNHIMLDIETMGNTSYSSIVSIAAVKFDINTAQTDESFYTAVDLQSCLDLGLTVNSDTIMWWMNQSPGVRKEFLYAPKPIKEVLAQFSTFCNKDYFIWGNSARFDCGILENAYHKAGMSIPWDFRKERCLRTLSSLFPDEKDKFTNIEKHHALYDCFYQIQYCSAIWRKIVK